MRSTRDIGSTTGHAIYADFVFEEIVKSSLRFQEFLAEQQAKKAL